MNGTFGGHSSAAENPRGQMKFVWPLLPNDPFSRECHAEFVVVSLCLNIDFQFIT